MICSPGATPLGILILPSGSIVAPVPSSSIIVTVTLSVVAGVPLILSLSNIFTLPPVLGRLLGASGCTSIVLVPTVTVAVAGWHTFA